MKCDICGGEMIKRGFGEVGSFIGNARWECRKGVWCRKKKSRGYEKVKNAAKELRKYAI